MAEPFIGEIKMAGFNFAPKGWALCDGQILPVKENQALAALLGTTYGGDGRTTFGLPDMRCRIPVGQGSVYDMGYYDGAETVTLTVPQMAAHRHQAVGTREDGDQFAPATNRCLATSTDPGDLLYGEPDSLVPMHEGVIGMTGGSQSHNNVQPTQAINFCIALNGTFPSRN